MTVLRKKWSIQAKTQEKGQIIIEIALQLNITQIVEY